jgi:hypothetical protein
VGIGWAIWEFGDLGGLGLEGWGRLLCAHGDKGRADLEKIQTYVRK